MAAFNCPNCGALLTPPEQIERLSVDCSFCHQVVDLPDRDKRILAQQRQRQGERSHALVQDHLRSARAMQTRITLLVVTIVVLTMGLTFYRVFFGATR
jgi:DNA-directed RNA polymerase subunit M/transcription elongation factor TFIIS